MDLLSLSLIPATAAIVAGLAAWVVQRERAARALHDRRVEEAVDALRAQLERLVAGDWAARGEPAGVSASMDRLVRLLNGAAEQTGATIDHLGREHGVLAATLESMLEGLLLLDVDGRILRANATIVALLEGGTPGEARLRSDRSLAGWPLIGRALREVVDASDQAFAETLFAEVSGAPLRERAVRFRIPGGTLALTVNAAVYRGIDGQVHGVVLVVRDDRDLKEAQAQLQMTGRLAAMGTVAAGVAHEINNPLAFVLSNLDFALEELALPDATRREEALAEVMDALAAARHGGERVRKIVQELKALSRSEDDSSGSVDVNALIGTAVQMLDNEIRHHARLELALGEVAPVRATEAKLGQVFLNLIQNATQAIAPGRVQDNLIRVTSGMTVDGQVCVEVADTGSGIAPEHLDRLFEAFFTTKPVGLGTGLGLAISHRVVTGLGGRMEVDSAPGEGARFRVLLPAASVG